MAGVASFISIRKSATWRMKDDAVAIYTGIPDSLLDSSSTGSRMRPPCHCKYLPEDTQNRLREGIPQKSLKDAQDAVENYPRHKWTRRRPNSSRTRAPSNTPGPRRRRAQAPQTPWQAEQSPSESPANAISPSTTTEGGAAVNFAHTTELLLLIATAFPVTLLYAMYVVTTGAALFLCNAAPSRWSRRIRRSPYRRAHLRRPAPTRRILPSCPQGIGIAFVTRLQPERLGWPWWARSAVVKNLEVIKHYEYVLGIAGIVLLVLPMFIGTEYLAPSCGSRSAACRVQPR